MIRLFGVLLLLTLQPALANGDPYEGVNRKIHNFNDVVDRKLFRPVAVWL